MLSINSVSQRVVNQMYLLKAEHLTVKSIQSAKHNFCLRVTHRDKQIGAIIPPKTKQTNKPTLKSII